MEIKTFGVVGAGQMGQGIAEVAAFSGIDVILLDVSDELAAKGKSAVEKRLSRLVDKGKIERAAADAALSKITTSGDYASFADADFVVEAATEQIAIKEKILQSIDRSMKKDGIIASNTSSISLTKLAAFTSRPEQVIGMHFMNPVPLMKLVEIIRALQTSDETLEATIALGEALGKTIVSTKDLPGFVVNRMLIPFLNEACFALQDGLGSVEEMDKAIQHGLNHPLGPFALTDLIGLDTVLYIAEVLHREFGDDKYRPPAILRNYVAAGWLGRKAGRGFYRYDAKGRVI